MRTLFLAFVVGIFYFPTSIMAQTDDQLFAQADHELQIAYSNVYDFLKIMEKSIFTGDRSLLLDAADRLEELAKHLRDADVAMKQLFNHGVRPNNSSHFNTLFLTREDLVKRLTLYHDFLGIERKPSKVLAEISEDGRRALQGLPPDDPNTALAKVGEGDGVSEIPDEPIGQTAGVANKKGAMTTEVDLTPVVSASQPSEVAKVADDPKTAIAKPEEGEGVSEKPNKPMGQTAEVLDEKEAKTSVELTPVVAVTSQPAEVEKESEKIPAKELADRLQGLEKENALLRKKLNELICDRERTERAISDLIVQLKNMGVSTSQPATQVAN